MDRSTRFSASFAAFACDLFLILAFCFVLAAVLASYRPLMTVALFLLYNGILRTGGRRTLGQRLLRREAVLGRSRMLACVLGLLLISGGAFTWRLRRLRTQALVITNAQLGLQTLAHLDRAFHQRTGVYAPNLETLLQATGREAEFRKILPQALDMSTLRLLGDKDSFLIEAAALDEKRTRVTVRNAR